MNREMFNGRFFVPSASLSLFNVVSIVALIPVYDRLFVPLLSKFGRKLSLLQRIGGPAATSPVPPTLTLKSQTAVLQVTIIPYPTFEVADVSYTTSDTGGVWDQ